MNKFKEIVEICEYASELNETLYSKYMKKIINLGGNQTANGCIFGGLLGSIVGFKELPKDYVQKLMKVKF